MFISDLQGKWGVGTLRNVGTKRGWAEEDIRVQSLSIHKAMVRDGLPITPENHKIVHVGKDL